MKNLVLLTCSFLLMALSIPEAQGQCSGSETEINVTIQPDDYGSETTWEIRGVGGSPVYGSGGPYTDGDVTLKTDDVCVPTGTQVVFTINDVYGDGICCDYGNGSYQVMVSGLIVASGGNFAASESSTFFAPPVTNDAALAELSMRSYYLLSDIDVNGTIKNVGSNTIQSVEINYAINNGTTITQTLTGLNINPFTEQSFTHPTSWMPSSVGTFNVRVWISQVNGNADSNTGDNELDQDITINPAIPNIIDNYLLGNETYETVATSTDDVDTPRDLDFHPDASIKQLWVINKGTENTGGSTVTITNAGESTQTIDAKQDGNAWHFMSLPTGIAFSENGNFATSPGVFDANHDGGTPFTGPALWSSDLSIYAEPSGGNGSHLDMLHASPYAQGIAHHEDNAFWVFDGNSNDIVYYDFNDDHGPGNADHSDGVIKRYSDFSVAKDPGNHIVSHMILDKNTGWLYIVDHGNKRVLRMNTNTGNPGGAPGFGPFETLAEYSTVTGYDWEVIIDSGLVEPAGIDLIEDRLLVSDHSDGDIIIYDMENGFSEMGRINTGASGIMGIKIGPEGRIWYVNATDSEVLKVEPDTIIDPNPPTSTADLQVDQTELKVYPNPAKNTVNVRVVQTKDFSEQRELTIYNLMGKAVMSDIITREAFQLDVSSLVAGTYFLKVKGNATPVKFVLVE